MTEQPPQPQPPQLPPDDGLWLKSLRSEVQPETFKKGRSYAEARRVSDLARTDLGIQARVLGSEDKRYAVRVGPGETEGVIDSTCEGEE